MKSACASRHQEKDCRCTLDDPEGIPEPIHDNCIADPSDDSIFALRHVAMTVFLCCQSITQKNT